VGLVGGVFDLFDSCKDGGIVNQKVVCGLLEAFAGEKAVFVGCSEFIDFGSTFSLELVKVVASREWVSARNKEREDFQMNSLSEKCVVAETQTDITCDGLLTS